MNDYNSFHAFFTPKNVLYQMVFTALRFITNNDPPKTLVSEGWAQTGVTIWIVVLS